MVASPADELILLLDGHCIETTARRRYRRLIQHLLDDSPPDDQAARQLELLRGFLQQTDFPDLRANDPELGGQTLVRVRVFRNKNGGVSWEKVDP